VTETDDRNQPDAAPSGETPSAERPPEDTPPEETLGTVFKKLGPAGVLGVIALVLPALGGFLLLGSLNIVGPWLQSHGALGIVAYAAAFAVLAGLAILPTYAQAALGGWAFGLTVGFPAALVGFFGGSLIGYAVARRASGERVEKLLAEHPKWRVVRDALVGAGFWKTLLIVTLVRVPANSPFAATNLVMSAMKTPIVPYLIGTLAGMAPRTFLYVYVASLIQGEINRDALDAARPVWLFPVAVASAVLSIVIVGWIAQRALKKATGLGATC